MCRNWEGAQMEVEILERQRVVNARAYLYYGQMHSCCRVQVLRRSPHAWSYTLAYFHLISTDISCHIHGIKRSMAWTRTNLPPARTNPHILVCTGIEMKRTPKSQWPMEMLFRVNSTNPPICRSGEEAAKPRPKPEPQQGPKAKWRKLACDAKLHSMHLWVTRWGTNPEIL